MAKKTVMLEKLLNVVDNESAETNEELEKKTGYPLSKVVAYKMLMEDLRKKKSHALKEIEEKSKLPYATVNNCKGDVKKFLVAKGLLNNESEGSAKTTSVSVPEPKAQRGLAIPEATLEAIKAKAVEEERLKWEAELKANQPKKASDFVRELHEIEKEIKELVNRKAEVIQAFDDFTAKQKLELESQTAEAKRQMEALKAQSVLRKVGAPDESAVANEDGKPAKHSKAEKQA